MDNLKAELQRMFDMLDELEKRARNLANQNLADIAASARGRVKQLCDHADTELVADGAQQFNDDGTPKAAVPFDPKAGADVPAYKFDAQTQTQT